MNSYRYRQKPSMQRYGTKGQQRLMLIGIIALAALCVVMAISLARSLGHSEKAKMQFQRRVESNLQDAIGEVSRMTGSVQSTSTIRLGMIRQHIYVMDQINIISMSIYGDSGRILPQEAIAALYEDLNRYEIAIQTATGNILEERTQMLEHLKFLESIIKAQNQS